jgi:hypothetical protein
VIKGLEEKVYDITAGPYHKNPEKYAVYVLQRIENGTNDKFRVEEIIGKKGVKSFEERGYEHLAVDKEGHLYLYQSISGLLEFEHEHQIDIHFYNKPDEYDALEFPKKEMAIATYMRKIDCMKFDNQDRLFVVGREHNSESCLIQRCEKKF